MRTLATMLLLILASPAPAQVWSGGVSGFLFDPPHDNGYFSPVARADRGRLHLEARYNYENLETVSVFAGWNLTAGGEVALAATPILGLVAGRTDGVAPGLEAEVTWRAFAFNIESEYVFAFDGSDDSFLYTWSEVTYAPMAWLRGGLVVQKTETYQTDLEVQRGPMAEVSRRAWRLGMYWFNPDRSDDGLFVGSLGYQF
jgi:hypothetical protein